MTPSKSKLACRPRGKPRDWPHSVQEGNSSGRRDATLATAAASAYATPSSSIRCSICCHWGPHQLQQRVLLLLEQIMPPPKPYIQCRKEKPWWQLLCVCGYSRDQQQPMQQLLPLGAAAAAAADATTAAAAAAADDNPEEMLRQHLHIFAAAAALSSRPHGAASPQ